MGQNSVWKRNDPKYWLIVSPLEESVVCWVLDIWHQADLNTMVPKHLSEYGWQISKNTLNVDWDSENNMVAVRERVAGLLKGCSCKTGCETRQCGCKRNDKKCGEGCNCTNCKNKQHTTQTQEESDDLAEASIEEIIADGPSSENRRNHGLGIRRLHLKAKVGKTVTMKTESFVYLPYPSYKQNKTNCNL